jgi:RNA recognition motif-containing protein
VWDIPYNFTKKDIAMALEKSGKLEHITLSENGLTKSATVTFVEQDDYDRINFQWSISHTNACMRIFPYHKTRETRMTRESITATLTQLPQPLTTNNIREIMEVTHAKTCYIPKDRDNQPKHFAILSFATQKACDEAKSSP